MSALQMQGRLGAIVRIKLLCLTFLSVQLCMLLFASIGDVMLHLQTGESWNRCVRPKAIGAWNLHELTKALPSVEQFVLFSSVVSWVGHQGALPPPAPAPSGVRRVP